MKTIENEQEHFIFSGFDTVELARKYGTPLYVISEDIIRNRCQELKRTFLHRYGNTKAAYASKAFLTLAMCKIIQDEGLYLDVVSGGELYTAIKAGFPMERVMLHGNNKSHEEIRMAVENNVGRIIVDNIDEIDLIQKIAQKFHKTVKILLRVAPGVEGNTHRYIITGQKDSKFGIPLEEGVISSAVLKAVKSPNIELMGFHFHIGSQLYENEPYVLAVEVLMELFKKLKDGFGFIVKELNTGGGFGIRYNNGDKEKPLDYYIDAIMNTVYVKSNQLGLDIPTVIIEPGRWIVGQAGITLYTVGTVKEIPNIRTYVSINGGFPDNPRPALYNAKYSAVVANKYNLKADRTVTIAGKCCETGDILIWDLDVPEVEMGDILAVLSTGAYNYSMASNYNRLPRPAVVMLSGNKDTVIVEREKYDDLIKKESIPEHLLDSRCKLVNMM